MQTGPRRPVPQLLCRWRVRSRLQDAECHFSSTTPVVLAPPAQSAVPFPRVRFEWEIDPVCGNAVMEVPGSVEKGSPNRDAIPRRDPPSPRESSNKTGNMSPLLLPLRLFFREKWEMGVVTTFHFESKHLQCRRNLWPLNAAAFKCRSDRPPNLFFS